ncbi:MAG: sulfotransferase family 2 domain-containing protein [Hoeflea sp.]|uniref:sulfotransferase family 2 domain-containing protein n=1 Tax=Hoeflea sp. TaxID=1940281 RepID=UPI003EF82AB2
MPTKFVNIHIPKTAGTTLRSHLGWVLGSVSEGRSQVIGIDQGVDGLEYFEGLREAFALRFPEITSDGMQVISGHYRYRDIADVIAPLRDQLTVVSFVRDPITRTLSDYFYSISDRHSAPEAFVARYPTFEDYLRNEGEMNKQLDYLRPHDGASVEETIECLSSNLDFIGVTEQFDADFAEIMAAAGLDFERLQRSNVNPDRDAMLEARERHMDQLNEALRLEYQIYDAIRKHRNETI